MSYFTNEDFFDYVLAVPLMYQKGLLEYNGNKLNKSSLLLKCNLLYPLYCKSHRLKPQRLVPIRSLMLMNLPEDEEYIEYNLNLFGGKFFD